MADVNITAASGIALKYVGDTAVQDIPCTAGDMIDQGVFISDGRLSDEEVWEGDGVIISPAIPAGTKKVYAFSDPDLGPWDSQYDGTLDVDFTANPKTAHIIITKYPGGGGGAIPDGETGGVYTDLQPVSSSNIAAVGWVLFQGWLPIMEVEFLNGSLYAYERIPESMFNDMMSANSHGTWFWDNIRRDDSISYWRIR